MMRETGMSNDHDVPLTAEEVCAICHMSRAKLDRFTRVGRGPRRYMINGREYRYLRTDVLRWNRERFLGGDQSFAPRWPPSIQS